MESAAGRVSSGPLLRMLLRIGFEAMQARRRQRRKGNRRPGVAPAAMEGLARAAAAMRCAAADRRGGGSRAARLVARLPAEAPPRAASLIALRPAHPGLSLSFTGTRVDLAGPGWCRSAHEGTPNSTVSRVSVGICILTLGVAELGTAPENVGAAVSGDAARPPLLRPLVKVLPQLLEVAHHAQVEPHEPLQRAKYCRHHLQQ